MKKVSIEASQIFICPFNQVHKATEEVFSLLHFVVLFEGVVS